MIKGIIFDLDGTLLDTVIDLRTAVNLVLDEYGFERQSYQQIKDKTGNGFRNIIKRSLPENSENSLIDEATEKFKKYYRIHYLDQTKPYKGIRQLVDQLNKKNILLGVNSNKHDEYTKNLIKKIFPHNNFIDVIGSRENVPNKPDPTSALEIVKKMQLTIDEVVYVGDSEIDMKTACNGGFTSVACLWGFRDEETLKQLKPNHIISKPEELLQIIKGEN